MTDVITFQIHHDYTPDSNPYVDDVEQALDALKAKGLVERGWDKSGQPGIIRHETGPEILLAAVALVQMATAVLELYLATRKHHPQASITIAVTDPASLKAALDALAK